MFDGVPDQFHQFIASSRTSLPIPLSFPLHGASPAAAAPPPPPTFPSFDPYPVLQQHVAAAHHGHHHNLHHQQLHHQLSKDIEKKEEEQQSSSSSSLLAAANLVLDRDRSIPEPPADNLPWSNDEVLTLLRIRSSLDTWFPDFTWEHVSRKLAELGFKRSAEKCKEKFEEESRHFNSLSYNNKNFRFFTELDELYHGGNVDHQVLTHEKNQNVVKQNEQEKEKEEEEEEEEEGHSIEEDSGNKNDQEVKKSPDKSKKRKRNYKFEMVKGFCEAIVNKIMSQQEELHNKFIEDMVKRDEEMIAREEAWKHQEMDRLIKEIEMRAKEQAIANDRQAMLIDFLKKFTSSSSSSTSCDQDHQHDLAKKIEDFLKMATIGYSTSTSPCEILPQNVHDTSKVSISTRAKLDMPNNSSSLLVSHQLQNPSSLPTQKNPNAPSSSSETLSPQNPNSLQPTNVPNETSSSTPSLSTQNPNSSKVHEHPLLHTPSSSYKSSNDQREDVGKRWPRDEVLALINLRCSLINSNNNNNINNNSEDSREGAKGPLWERISQGMHQLGYKRSAKRCKEKWENINKYFRKTKDNNKKRSLDSRTCPYYHQLSNLYGQGILVAPTDAPENRSSWPKNHHSISENTSMAPQSVSNDGGLHVAEGEGGNKISTTQLQSFKFEA